MMSEIYAVSFTIFRKNPSKWFFVIENIDFVSDNSFCNLVFDWYVSEKDGRESSRSDGVEGRSDGVGGWSDGVGGRAEGWMDKWWSRTDGRMDGRTGERAEDHTDWDFIPAMVADEIVFTTTITIT